MSWLKKILPDDKSERDNLLKGLVAGVVAVLLVLVLSRLAGC
jgi:hypothetical protein